MLRRQYSSIAEEPEDDDVRNNNKPRNNEDLSSKLDPITEQPPPPDKLPSSQRNSTDNGRLSTTSMTVDTMEESGSERLSDDEDDVFTEASDSMTKYQHREPSNPGENISKPNHRAPEDLGESVRKGFPKDWQKGLEIPRTPSPADSIKGDSELTENQVREIKEAFLVFDDNGDGCISATELKKLVTSLGYNITEAELMDMMNQIDSDGNGAIDFPEFLQLMTKNLQDTDPDDIMMETFKVFDRDNNRSIGVDELQRVMRLLGQDFKDYEIEAMLQGSDYDGDGAVGYEDFTRLMSS